MTRITRRHFLITSAATAASVACIRPSLSRLTGSDKLRLGVVGVSGRGGANLSGVQHEEIAALCDVDEGRLDGAMKKHPKAGRFVDFRKMLDEVKLDGVVVSTADHTHAVIGLAAMERGKHLYCEKPMSWSVDESRRMQEMARSNKLVTQMGTQIHANEPYRRTVELVRAGAIGAIREVHVWVGKAWVGSDRPKATPPVPKGLHWDLWLGPAPARPYHPAYHPARWRGWWDFGGGTLSDMACHHMDLPFWALDLDHPTSVEPRSAEQVHPESAPRKLEVTWTFPTKGGRPPVALTWYQGGPRPKYFENGGLPRWGDGTLFVGDKGMMLADYGRNALLPEANFKDYQRPPQSIERSKGHHREWTEAIKGNGTTTCRFDYSGPLTETVLLGNVAFRAGETLQWDAQKMTTGSAKGDSYIRREARKDW